MGAFHHSVQAVAYTTPCSSMASATFTKPATLEFGAEWADMFEC